MRSPNFTGSVKIGSGKVTVMIRNGRVTTGSESINRLLPKNLGRNAAMDWVSCLTGTPFVEIAHLKSPLEVVRFYVDKNKNAPGETSPETSGPSEFSSAAV